MKRKIRIKIKYIIFIQIIIFCLIPNMLFLISKSISESDDYKKFSYGILDLYTKYPKILSPFEGEAFYNLSKMKYNINEKKLISNMESGILLNYFKFETVENLDEAIEFNKKGLKYKKSNYFGRNAINLMNLYLEKGNLEEAEIISNSLIKESDFKIKLSGEIGKLYLFHISNLKEEAVKYGKELSKKYKNNLFNEFNYNILNGYPRENYNLTEELVSYDIDKNKKFILKTLNEINLVHKSIPLNDGKILNEVFDFKNKKEYYNGKNKLKGKLTYKGKPLKYRPVILGGLEDISATGIGNEIQVVSNHYVLGNLESNTEFVTYTDENGFYEFNNIPNIKKELGIFTTVPIYILNKINLYGLKNEKIILEKNKENEFNLDLEDSIEFKTKGVYNLKGDKFKIEFDKVKGADKYCVYLDYYGNYGNKNKDLAGIGLSNFYFVNDNKLEIELKDGAFISQMYRNPLPKEERKGEYLDNVGLIKKGEITVMVEALDKDNNIINSTNKFFYGNKYTGLILQGKEKEINKGEKLFLNKNFKEGIEWFKEKIKIEGIKKEYLYPLIYLSINEDIISKKDSQKLIDKLYEINKNKSEFNYFKSILDEKN